MKRKMLKNKESTKVKTTKTSPADKASLGPASSMGPIPGFAKGGSIDGCAKKGRTKGRMC